MNKVKVYFFPQAGTINLVFNDFANFIMNRKSPSESIERRFINKLQSLSGITNSPSTLLQQRIDNGDIDYAKLCWSRDLIKEMQDAIRRHSK